jgi:hypothetical protein
MVNTSGLRRRSTYEEVMREVQLDNFKDAVKLPDRTATFVLEAPEMVALDPENEEAIIQFEKRKRAEHARKEEVAEVAQRRGISQAELELATRPSRGEILGAPDDEFERRRYEFGIRQAAEVYETAQVRATNVERVRDQLRRELVVANRTDPIARLASEDAVYYDMSTPPDHEIDLHLPSVPARIASEAGSFAAELGSNALMIATHAGPPALSALGQAARIAANYGPTVARGTARGTVAVAEVSARGSVAAAGLVAQGLVSGGQVAAQAALAATNLLASTTPAHHRGGDFQRSNGITVGRAVTNMLLARHALH